MMDERGDGGEGHEKGRAIEQVLTRGVGDAIQQVQTRGGGEVDGRRTGG